MRKILYICGPRAIQVDTDRGLFGETGVDLFLGDERDYLVKELTSVWDENLPIERLLKYYESIGYLYVKNTQLQLVNQRDVLRGSKDLYKLLTESLNIRRVEVERVLLANGLLPLLTFHQDLGIIRMTKDELRKIPEDAIVYSIRDNSYMNEPEAIEYLKFHTKNGFQALY